jgi:hypothetical protein
MKESEQLWEDSKQNAGIAQLARQKVNPRIHDKGCTLRHDAENL